MYANKNILQELDITLCSAINCGQIVNQFRDLFSKIDIGPKLQLGTKLMRKSSAFIHKHEHFYMVGIISTISNPNILIRLFKIHHINTKKKFHLSGKQVEFITHISKIMRDLKCFGTASISARRMW